MEDTIKGKGKILLAKPNLSVALITQDSLFIQQNWVPNAPTGHKSWSRK